MHSSLYFNIYILKSQHRIFISWNLLFQKLHNLCLPMSLLSTSASKFYFPLDKLPTLCYNHLVLEWQISLHQCCKADLTNEVRLAPSLKPHPYDVRCCFICTEGYRSGHNEAVLKTSFVFLCNFLKTLDFIGFFGGRLAFCEKPFSQFSRNFLT